MFDRPQRCAPGTALATVLLVSAALAPRTLAENSAPLKGIVRPMALELPSNEYDLEAIRSAGNLGAERHHVWQLLEMLTRPRPDGLPAFLGWYGAGEVFSPASSGKARNLEATLSLPIVRTPTVPSTGPPLIIRAHYNAPAYDHIRDHGLYHLLGLPVSQPPNANPAADVPAFPRTSVVVKTVWWPVPSTGVVAIPVWDPALNPPAPGGNDYPSWARVVAVSLNASPASDAAAVTIEFLGKTYAATRRAGIEHFFHLVLDQRLAAEVMTDPAARRVALMVLGRPMRGGDALALVALHVATREIPDWIWGTFWWHDQPDKGPFAAQRPGGLSAAWRNYLMNVAFDSDLPRQPDGSPHIAYNPWLEARLPDTGAGSGVQSNCMACHQRASIAAKEPFIVTRGAIKMPAGHSAGVPDLRTSSLWSLVLQGTR